MSKTYAVLGLAASLCAAAAPALAGSEARQNWPTLEEVTASAPVSDIVRVDCDNAMWPTARQIARRVADSSEAEIASLRHHIVSTGRAVCASGFTHALVVFRASPAEVAVRPAAKASASDG
jgi:hypothetical protein